MSRLVSQPEDALRKLIALFRADPRHDKVDLSVGVFRDGAGATSVLGAAKSTEALLLSIQSSRCHLGAEGRDMYAPLLGRLVFGKERPVANYMKGIQESGGTGAPRLSAELIRPAWRNTFVPSDNRPSERCLEQPNRGQCASRSSAVWRMLASVHPRVAPSAAQRGMFTILRILPDEVFDVQGASSVDMNGDGRISIAGHRRAVPLSSLDLHSACQSTN